MDIPFKILALAPFKPREENPWTNSPIRVDKSNIDNVMEGLDLSLFIPLPKDLCRSGGITISLKRLKDFHPDSIIKTNPFLKSLLEARQFIEDAKTRGLSCKEVSQGLQEWSDLPIHIKVEDIKVEEEKSDTHSKSPIDTILKMVSLPEEAPRSSRELSTSIMQIDSIIQEVSNHIFSYKEFRDLESSWQGVRLFMKQGNVNGKVTLEIVPVSMDTLDETLDRLTAGLGEEIPSLIIVDLSFDSSPRSLAILHKIADFAETFLAPAACWISPHFFHLDTWDDLKELPFLPHYLEEPAFAKWRRLKERPSSKWLAISCNRFLARSPYDPDNKLNSIRFEESQPIWVSPVWALASLIGKSIARTGWSTRFTEWKNIRIEDLAIYPEKGDKSFPTETAFSEERIYQFIKAGFIPLVSMPNQDIAFTPSETIITGGSLSYQLFISRISHLFLWCNRYFEKDLSPYDIERTLSEAFTEFWVNTGHEAPKHMEISAEKPDPNKPTLVRLMIEPPRQVLPTGGKVEIEFFW